MNMTAPSLPKLGFLILPAIAFGQGAPVPPERWTVGVAVAAIDSAYAGEGARVRPLPLISYEGERFFLRGVSGGMHLYQSRPFTLDAILSARLDGFDIDDLGRPELLANGLDADRLSDRDDGLDAGFRAAVGSARGVISLEATGDASDASDGYEVSLDYSYTWRFNQSSMTTNAGASWMSSDLTGYYFGILDEEVSRGVTAYSPGSAVVPRLGVTLTHVLGSTKWLILGAVEYQFLPDELRDNPLLEPDTDGFGRAIVGLSWRF